MGRGHAEVEVGYRESFRPVPHQGEDLRGDQVYAAEGETAAARRVEAGVRAPDLSGAHVGPAREAHVAVEQKIAVGLVGVGDQQGRERGGVVGREEAADVEVAEHVDVVDEETAPFQEGLRLAYAASRLQWLPGLAGDVDVHAEVAVLREEILYLLREMVDVDHELAYSCRLELHHHALQHRNSAHGHQGLGHAVGERAQARAQTRGEDHRLHSTFTPGRMVLPSHSSESRSSSSVR